MCTLHGHGVKFVLFPCNLGDRWTAASVDIAGCLRIWNAEATKSIQYLHGLTCVTRVAGSAALVVGSETGCVRLVSTAPLQTACAVRVCEVPILAVCTAKRANGVVVVTALTLDKKKYKIFMSYFFVNFFERKNKKK